MRCSRCRVGRWEFSHRLLQIPPDLVVKSQVIDMAEINSSRIRRSNAVPMLCRNRTSRFAQLFTSEAHWSTTKSDGMWNFPALRSIHTQTPEMPHLHDDHPFVVERL